MGRKTENPRADAPTLPPQYLTESQAAAVTGIASATLRTWRSRRLGPPFVKLGGAVRYPVDALHAWCAAQSAAA